MCRNRKFGCDWNGKIGELVEHLSSCAYEKEECPHCKEGFSLSEVCNCMDVLFIFTVIVLDYYTHHYS